MNFIEKWLAQFLEAFKAKNAKVWAGLVAVATVLQFGINAVLELTIPGVVIPPELLSLDWILTKLDLQVSDAVTDIIMWVLIAITGSQTTASLPLAAREAKIQKTQRKIMKNELKRAGQL